MKSNNVIALRDIEDTPLDDAGAPVALTREIGAETAKMPVSMDHPDLDRSIESACARIAPLWPLKHYVAVNPLFGLIDR